MSIRLSSLHRWRAPIRKMSASTPTRQAAWRLASQRIERLDARLLLERVCRCTHAELIAEPACLLALAEAAAYETLVARRLAGEPLAYLLESAFFLGREFIVTPDVLIPRADTEVLVTLALQKIAGRPAPHIVDLGTGSGIVAISIANSLSLACPTATISAVDISEAAIAVARRNAERHGANIRFLAGDWYTPLGGECFDLIVSNPPYIAADDRHLRGDGLPFEPQIALTDGDAGGDGMACINILVAGAHQHLQAGGWLLMEHGYDQAVKVRRLLGDTGFADIESWRDAAGIERVSGGRMPKYLSQLRRG